MEKISKVKSISIWIFIVPFIAINACLILVTKFHSLFAPIDIIQNTIPYFDGGTSISRTARVFPTYFIFKPAMLLTSFLLVKYWLWNKNIINQLDSENKYVSKIIFFGIGSALLLAVHSIFLGIKLDYSIYKLFRRVVMVLFISFEIAAQAYLVFIFYNLGEKINLYINFKILFAKRILVTLLIIIAVISIPIVSMDGNKAFKHALEWNYFVGVIFFYLLTYFMWKRTN